MFTGSLRFRGHLVSFLGFIMETAHVTFSLIDLPSLLIHVTDLCNVNFSTDFLNIYEHTHYLLEISLSPGCRISQTV